MRPQGFGPPEKRDPEKVRDGAGLLFLDLEVLGRLGVLRPRRRPRRGSSPDAGSGGERNVTAGRVPAFVLSDGSSGA